MATINRIIYKRGFKKTLNRKSIVRKLDSTVSIIVRNIYPCCVTCGSVESPTAGHVFSRKAYNTRWDFSNVFRQCWPCNRGHVWDSYPYFDWYIRTYGMDKFNELRRKFKTIKKYKTYELLELLENIKLEYKEYL